eukprot:14117936-Ditylum_brightwellii.AAC.1
MSSSEYEKIERHSLFLFEKTWCLTPCFTWLNSPLAVNVASLFESEKNIFVQYSPPTMTRKPLPGSECS